MLERIDDLPSEVSGLRATGTVSEEDYEHIVIPLLEEAWQDARHIRLLFHFGPEFDGFTPGAAWEDMKVGWRDLRLFERCAVVSDQAWIRTSTRAVGAMMPCPVRIFGNAEQQEAVSWLSTPLETSLDFRILPDRGVVVVEPHGKLSPGDFETLEAVVDDWIDARPDALNGLVIHVREFPGWEDLGSAWRHIRFVRDHHRRIPRVALASDSKLAALAPTLTEHFLEAEIERFDWDALDDAIHWASGGRTTGRRSST